MWGTPKKSARETSSRKNLNRDCGLQRDKSVKLLRMNSRPLIFILAASVLLPVSGCAGAGTSTNHWGLAGDFSTVANPAGTWSYGEQVNGVFTLAPKSLGYNLGPAWDGVISVNKNTSFTDGISPNEADLDADNTTPDARWTAPYAGVYNIDVLVGGSDTQVGSNGQIGNVSAANAQFLVNGTAATATSFTNNVMTFSLTRVSLAAGATLDVVIPQKLGGGNTQVIFEVKLQ
jgi:hypothetical protein